MAKTTKRSASGRKAPARNRKARAHPAAGADNPVMAAMPAGLFEPMERMMRWFWPWLGIIGPRVDVIERERDLVVRAEVPGAEKGALDVEIGDHSLTIRGATHEEKTRDHGDYVRAEISRDEFERTVILPVNVDAARARAELKDGVLEVTLPRTDRRGSVKLQPRA